MVLTIYDGYRINGPLTKLRHLREGEGGKSAVVGALLLLRKYFSSLLYSRPLLLSEGQKKKIYLFGTFAAFLGRTVVFALRRYPI